MMHLNLKPQKLKLYETLYIMHEMEAYKDMFTEVEYSKIKKQGHWGISLWFAVTRLVVYT